MSVLDVVRILRTTKQADAAAQAAEAAKVARVAEQTKKAQSVQRIQVGSEVIEFPADMPDDKIKAALKKHYGPSAAQQKITALEQENVALKNKPAERVEPRITASLKNKYVDDHDGMVRTVFTADDVTPEMSTALDVPLYAKGFERQVLNVPLSARWQDVIKTRDPLTGETIDFTVKDGVAYKGTDFLGMIAKDIETMADTGEILTSTEKKLWSAVAERLKRRAELANVPVVITQSPSMKEINAAGVYFAKRNVIILDANTLKRTGFYHTAIHEAVHARTFTALEEISNPVSMQVKALLDFAQKASPAPEVAPVYGYTNRHEFAAEALSNPKFYQRLKDIETPLGNVADRFVKIIGKLLGVGAVAVGTPEWDALEKIVAPQQVESDGA